MDTSDYPSLPNLNQLNARLAVSNRRVEALVDAQLDDIERMFSAVTREDWVDVHALSRRIAAANAETVGREVVREARFVVHEMSYQTHTAEQLKSPTRLSQLLTACRSVRKNITSSTSR